MDAKLDNTEVTSDLNKIMHWCNTRRNQQSKWKNNEDYYYVWTNVMN